MKKMVRCSTLLFLCFSLFFAACEKEDSSDNPVTDSETVRHISLDELKSDTKAFEKLSTFLPRDSGNTQSRIVYNQTYDFFVDTDEIISVEGKDNRSLFFGVLRDSTQGYVENLFLSRQPDGNYRAFLMRYNLSENDRKKEEQGLPIQDLSKKTTIVLLQDFDSKSVMSSRPACNPTFATECLWNPVVVEVKDDVLPIRDGNLVGHFATQTKTIYQAGDCSYTSYGCDLSSGGGINTGGGSSGTVNPFFPAYGTGPGPGGTSGGGDTSPAPGKSLLGPTIAIILNLKPTAEKNCDELKKLTNNTKIKDALTSLKPRARENKESGFTLQSNPGQNDTAEPLGQQPNDPYSIQIKTGGTNFGSMHSHPTGGCPMFSLADIYGLVLQATKYNTNGERRDFSKFVITVTSEQGTYALKIKDPNAFLASMNGLGNPAVMEKLKKSLNEDYYLLREPLLTPVAQFEKDMLSFIKDMNLGLSLYRADEALENWGELNLDPINSIRPVKVTNCN